MSSRRITIFDTTLRDGEQAPGIALRPDEKVEIGEQLERLGVDVIEAGFAASSPGDFEGVRAVARGGEARHRCLVVPRELHGHRRRGGRTRGRAALTDPHLPRDQRPAHGEEASPHARRGRRPRNVLGHPGLRERGRGRVLVRGRNAIRSRVRRHRLPCCRGGRRDHDQPPRHRRLHAAGRVRELHPVRTPSSAPSSSRLRSRPTATTTSGSRSRTRWQRSTPACSSSSAR